MYRKSQPADGAPRRAGPGRRASTPDDVPPSPKQSYRSCYVYGEPRGKTIIFLADVWSNLTTPARLFREATAATGD